MEYKVSYVKSWSCDGCHFDQRIAAKMSKEELASFNSKIKVKNGTGSNYLSNSRFLAPGKNYTVLTTRDLFKSHFKLHDKRIKDRNTLIVVQLI